MYPFVRFYTSFRFGTHRWTFSHSFKDGYTSYFLEIGRTVIFMYRNSKKLPNFPDAGTCRNSQWPVKKKASKSRQGRPNQDDIVPQTIFWVRCCVEWIPLPRHNTNMDCLRKAWISAPVNGCPALAPFGMEYKRRKVGKDSPPKPDSPTFPTSPYPVYVAHHRHFLQALSLVNLSQQDGSGRKQYFPSGAQGRI